MSRIFAVVPAHNEADRLEATISSLRSIPDIANIVVVADACTDTTAASARRMGVIVEERQGKGDKAAAVAMGIRRIAASCNPNPEDLLLLADADVGGTASQLHLLIDPVRSGQVDVTIALFPRAGRRAGHGAVVRLARALLLLTTGRVFRAPLSGQRVIRWSVITRLPRLAAGYGLEVGMLQDLSHRRLQIREIEVQMSHRHTGRGLDGYLHRARQGWHALLAIIGFRRVRLWE